jgi:alpha,alpha-trehalose-phosphate synthase [UDP-forming]
VPVTSFEGQPEASQRGGSRPLIVVSNREPYLHSYRPDGTIGCVATTGGVAVALDALMRERGGVWIAHGAGDADRAVVGPDDRIRVPPDEESYALHRIWLTEEEESRYYAGFANEGLWPLCHVAHVRPVFRSEDWAQYQAVNRRFATAIDASLPDPDAPVFIHDYHLALVASELRALRPTVRTAIFWHIPWPHPDRLRICPWRREVMTGLLANDLMAFQLERDRRNFLMAARDELQADVQKGVIRHKGRATTVIAVPIGVDYDRIREIAIDPTLESEMKRLRNELQIDTPLLGVGVDRLDYTKGIPERLEAIDRLLTKRSELKGRLTFVQVGVPSRSKLESYAAIEAEIDRKVAAINERHGTDAQTGPIRYRKSALKIRRLVALYRMADFCIVSSLHDGMNLVAKEFVAAREDLDGVLVLSELAGAAQELRDALLISPYDVDGFARALETAIDMPREERIRRMSRMRRVVAGSNVFSWASDILEGLENLSPMEIGGGRARA